MNGQQLLVEKSRLACHEENRYKPLVKRNSYSTINEESEESSTDSNADEKSAMQQLRRFSTERRANIGIENGSLSLETPLFQPVFRELDSSFCPDNGRNRQDELL